MRQVKPLSGPARHAFRLAGLWLLAAIVWALPGGAEPQAGRWAPVLQIDGIIGPATSDYVSQGIEAAQEKRAALIIIQMDTPGGLDASMRDIIQAILRSSVPVVVYVTPSGARAASAGTYILYASHVAAMAPGTNLGAATPVALGGGGSPFSPEEEQKGEQKPKTGDASDAKAVNDAVAYIRALAELRGRNVAWAEAAVRTAASLSANAALQQNVIDLVARDMDELLKLTHGRTVTAANEKVVVDTRNLSLEAMEPNWRTKLLAAVTNPNVALILMMIGVYGLLFEFMNPGSLYPGTIGAICLIIGLYALAVLPVNYAGVALIVLGLVLMAAEAFSPSFGVLGLGGLFAFIAGATVLIDTDLPQFRVDWPLIIVLGLAALGLSVVIARLAITSQRRKIVSGREEMIGLTGTVADWAGGSGHVIVHGERWQAVGTDSLLKGQPVQVVRIDGLTLTVAPVSPAEPRQSL